MRILRWGLVLASVGIAAIAGTSLISKTEERDERAQLMEIINEWAPHIDLEGEVVDEDYGDAFAIYRHIIATIQTRAGARQMQAKKDREMAIFNERPFYENFTFSVFFEYYQKAAGTLGVGYPLVANEFDPKKVDELIGYARKGEFKETVTRALYLTREKFQFVMTPDSNMHGYLRNLKRGRGDCFDIAFTGMNLLYHVFMNADRPDFAKRVRITYGPMTGSKFSHAVVGVKYDDWVSLDPTFARVIEDEIVVPTVYKNFVPILSMTPWATEGIDIMIQPKVHVKPHDR